MRSFGFIIVPYERTTSFMKGAAAGPRAILRDWRGLAAEGKVPQPGKVVLVTEEKRGGAGPLNRAVGRATQELLDDGLFPVLLGGEHTSILGAVRTLARHYADMGVVQFDAHADLRRSYQGSRYSHACTMRRIVDDMSLPLLPVGIRAYSRNEAAFMRDRGMSSLPGRLLGMWDRELPDLLRALPKKVYVTVDMDYFDPAVIPGVGTPEPGGGKWHETLEIMEFISRRREIVGLDIVELCPPREKAASVRAASRVVQHFLEGFAEAGN